MSGFCARYLYTKARHKPLHPWLAIFYAMWLGLFLGTVQGQSGYFALLPPDLLHTGPDLPHSPTPPPLPQVSYSWDGASTTSTPLSSYSRSIGLSIYIFPIQSRNFILRKNWRKILALCKPKWKKSYFLTYEVTKSWYSFILCALITVLLQKLIINFFCKTYAKNDINPNVSILLVCKEQSTLGFSSPDYSIESSNKIRLDRKCTLSANDYISPTSLFRFSNILVLHI